MAEYGVKNVSNNASEWGENYVAHKRSGRFWIGIMLEFK